MAAEPSGFFASVGGFLRKPARVSPPTENITSTARGPKRYRPVVRKLYKILIYVHIWRRQKAF